MVSKIKQVIVRLFDVAPEERLKVFFLALLYFLIIGSYTITRDMKNSIFLVTVGKEYLPWARMISMLMLVPAIFFYSRLVDKIKRYQLLIFYSLLFGIANLIFAYYIGHPTVGMLNTATSPHRLFGWFFYFFVEGYSPFVVSVFWSFANSVNNPNEAKKNYGYMVAGSKFGGIVSAAIAWYLLGLSAQAIAHPYFSDVVVHQLVLVVSSLFLAFIPIVAYLFVKMVPANMMHGYEAAYKLEEAQSKSKVSHKPNMFAGLEMFVRYPYVLGIFGMVFFSDVISTVVSYLRLSVIQAGTSSTSEFSQTLFEMAFQTQCIGFFLSLIGTQTLFSYLGTRRCLMLIPFVIGLFLFYFIFETTPQAVKYVFVALYAFHYAFVMPVRESLYLPTVKEIKFKSKSWIDAFGGKFSKASGSMFNVYASTLGASMMLSVYSFFFALVIGSWFVVAFLLGRRFEKAIVNNEVIGSEKEVKGKTAV